MMFSDSGTRGLHLAVGHAPVHRRELIATEEQPRRGPDVTSKSIGIGDRSAIEREICGHLEVDHACTVLRVRNGRFRPLSAS